MTNWTKLRIILHIMFPIPVIRVKGGGSSSTGDVTGV
jgi:hypothetical protein